MSFTVIHHSLWTSNEGTFRQKVRTIRTACRAVCGGNLHRTELVRTELGLLDVIYRYSPFVMEGQ
jgi:hypothetical protein